jgi:hypothetical protein
MILENELQRRGALDALKVLLTAKTRNIVDVDD